MPLNNLGTGLNKAAKTGGGASDYLSLTDTPSSRSGQAGKFLKCNAGETADEYAAVPGGGDLLAANNLSDVAVAATARTNLGLAIGSDVQAYDAELAAIAGLTSAANKGIQFTGVGTAATFDLTAFAKTILDDADAATVRATLGVDAAGTDNSTDVTLAGTPDYITIVGQVITRALVNLASHITGTLGIGNGGTGATTEAGARTNLGLGTMAVEAATDYVSADGATPLTDNWDVGAFTVTGTRFISDIATGTAPFGASSTTLVANLNADLLDSQEGSYYRDASNMNAGTLPDARVAESNVTQHRQAVLTLAEETGPELDAVLSADGKWSGIWIDGTAGATLAFGDVCYLAAVDSRWELADASAASTAGDVLVGICILAAASDGSATKLLLHGTIRADTAFPALTVSAPVYLSETAGDVTNTAPTTTDSVSRRLGFGIDSNSMFFNPSNDYITHT